MGRFAPGLLFFALLGASAPAEAAPKVEPLGAACDGAPAGMRAFLAQGLKVSLEGGPELDLWTCKSVPVEHAEKAALGAHYARIREGALIGVVRFLTRWKDAKGQSIAPGTYTLRYAIQPADGNHMGVSELRDFLVLGPVSSDSDPGAVPERDDLYGLGRKVSLTRHPAVMGLAPVPEGAAVPGVLDLGEGEDAIAVRGGTVTLGIVVQSRADGEAGR